MTTESSVLVNLKDLFEMEADRRAEEAAAKERAKAEEKARAEAERRAREAELEAVREDERRRADEERARRDAALEERLRTLRDELAEVRAQREEMRLKVSEIAARPAPRRGSWMAGVMAAASLVAAVTATAVAWPREPQQAALPAVHEVEVASPVAPVAEPVVEVVAPIDDPPAPEPVAVTQPEPARPRPPRVRHTQRDREHTLSEQLDLGNDDDVLGGGFLRDVGP